MTILKPLSAVLILSSMIAAPVWGQAAIQEPGAYAQNHPDADLGIGTNSPWPRYPSSYARAPFGGSESYAYTNQGDDEYSVPHHRVKHRRYHHDD
jgi:hypothetical protein